VIISENRKPPVAAFKTLMENTDLLLNTDAEVREDYYVSRGGKPLENDVYQALCKSAEGTEFEGTIQLVSGASFPDIIASKYYGVEVKSTEKNHWVSIGSSILESTRDANVERIFLTFGKLGKPVRFKSRPYEECLSDIAVTHYPRYRIDMCLGKGETIFDKMGVSYDQLRLLENPVTPVSKYYRSQLKAGESLWWAADNIDAEVPAKVRLWTTLSPKEKELIASQGYALFPEVLSSTNNKKYNRFALWLATNKGIVNTNIRDSFSAGGKVLMRSSSGIEIQAPAAFGRIEKYRNLIADTIITEEKDVLKEIWSVDDVGENRIAQWCCLAAEQAKSTIGYSQALDILQMIFSAYIG
jgi:hypothetical protein